MLSASCTIASNMCKTYPFIVLSLVYKSNSFYLTFTKKRKKKNSFYLTEKKKNREKRNLTPLQVMYLIEYIYSTPSKLEKRKK